MITVDALKLIRLKTIPYADSPQTIDTRPKTKYIVYAQFSPIIQFSAPSEVAWLLRELKCAGCSMAALFTKPSLSQLYPSASNALKALPFHARHKFVAHKLREMCCRIYGRKGECVNGISV